MLVLTTKLLTYKQGVLAVLGGPETEAAPTLDDVDVDELLAALNI